MVLLARRIERLAAIAKEIDTTGKMVLTSIEAVATKNQTKFH